MTPALRAILGVSALGLAVVGACFLVQAVVT
jgi:hypothetical protein